MDKYASMREITFPVLASTLGIDISKFKTRKDGREWYGRCPIHNPKQNSTSFSYAADGKFHCFSCEAKGKGGLDLTMKVKGIGFKDAVALLQPLSGFTPAPAKEKEPLSSDSGELRPLVKDTWRKFAIPCPWLEQRIPDAAVRERFGAFCYNNPARRSAYSGRVMLPVRDMQGNLYGYLGRAVEMEKSPSPTQDRPKYLFPKSLPKSRFLFGAHELTHQGTPHSGRLPVKVLYLLESPFSVMKFAFLGLPAVSCYGWSVSDEQLAILNTLAKGIVYLPDRNKWTQRDNPLAVLSASLWVRCPPLPAGIDDPEHLNLDQIQALTR